MTHWTHPFWLPPSTKTAAAELSRAQQVLDEAQGGESYATWKQKQDELTKARDDAQAKFDEVGGLKTDEIFRPDGKLYPNVTADQMNSSVAFQQETVKEHERDIADTKAKIADCQKRLDEANTDATHAVTSLNDLVCYLAGSSTNVKDDAGRTRDYLGQLTDIDNNGSPDNYVEYTETSINDFTKLGIAGDATTIENFKRGLDAIDKLNELREAEGLQPLKVTLRLTLDAALHSNWSLNSGTFDHASNHGYTNSGTAENIAAGTSKAGCSVDQAFKGWYTDEKKIYEDAVASGKYSGLEDMTAYQIYVNYPELFSKVGHYLNIVDPNSKYVGAAVNSGYNSDAHLSDVWAMQFDSRAPLGNGKAYTTAELRALLEQAQTDGVKLSYYSFYNQTTHEKSYLESNLANLEEGLTLSQQALEKARKLNPEGAKAADELEAAQKALDAHTATEPSKDAGGDTTALEEAVKRAQAKKDAQEKSTAAQKASSEATAKKDELNSKIADLQNQLANAQADKVQAGQDKADAESKLDAANKASEQLASASSDLKDAQAKATEAANGYASKKDAADALDGAVSALTSQVEAAQKDYEDKKAALSASGATDEQIKAMTDARDALDDAKKNLADLTDKRDAAKNEAAEAKATLDDASAKATEAQKAYDEAKRGLDDANAKLLAAQEKAAQWEATLANTNAEELVKTGNIPAGVANDEVKTAITTAHTAYQEKADALAAAKQAVTEAQDAYDKAVADQNTTEEERAEKLADLAVAQDAYNKIAARLTPAEEPPADDKGGSSAGDQTGDKGTGSANDNGASDAGAKPAAATNAKPAAKHSSEASVPKTGDPASAAAAIMAVAGAVAVTGGRHFRRRSE